MAIIITYYGGASFRTWILSSSLKEIDSSKFYLEFTSYVGELIFIIYTPFLTLKKTDIDCFGDSYK